MLLLRCALWVALVCAGLLHTADAQASAYPCHQDKPGMGNGVTCTTVALPKGMCSKCPLRPPNEKGQFKKCWDTYDTQQSACLAKVREYVKANPCDVVRADALAKLDEDPDDKKAHEVIDYFLYSVCEQCCDCVPMGSNDEFYSQYKAAHSLANPVLFDPARGNCAAHAVYDICKVLPKVQSFHLVGQPAKSGMPAACPMLFDWLPKNPNWQQDPQATISDDLRAFLVGMLGANECADEGIWKTCYALEEKQKHLGVPEEQPPAPEEPPGTERPPPPSTPSDSDAIDSSDPSSLDAVNTSPSTVPPTPEPEPQPATPDATYNATTTVPSDTLNATDNEAAKKPAPAPAKSPAAAPTTPDVLPGPGDSTGEPSDTGAPPSVPEEGVSVPEPGTDVPQPRPGVPQATPVEGQGDGEPEATAEPRECFPADATVELSDGATRRMAELRLGDVVRVDAAGRYEAVYAFSHADAEARSHYVQLTTAAGRSLTLTPGHVLELSGALLEAREAKVGDTVIGADGPSALVRVEKVRGTGLYNPHTPSGTIVVDGVLCTTFTHAVQPAAANALLAPLRAAFALGSCVA